MAEIPMEPMSADAAREVVARAVEEARDRFLDAVSAGKERIRFSEIAAHPLPTMIRRVIRSVEESFWRREVARRQQDTRFVYGDPALAEIGAECDRRFRATMQMSGVEFRQILHRAITFHTDAVLAPIESLKANCFTRQEKVPIRTAIAVATNIGFEERYLRALAIMRQEGDSLLVNSDDIRRVVRDVDFKEFDGSRDRIALSALSHALLILGIRSEDDFGASPTPLALAFLSLRGTPDGYAKVAETAAGNDTVDMFELDCLFNPAPPDGAKVAETAPSEEVERFLDDIGAEDDVSGGETNGASGGVRFMISDEEKRTYVERAVGRFTNLIEPILHAAEGALTWEEVDRIINGMIPDEMRDEINVELRSRARRR